MAPPRRPRFRIDAFLAGNFLHRDGARARCFINVDQLLGGWIWSGNEHVSQEHRKRFVADKIFRDENGMAEAQRLFLTRVTDLHHVADIANHFGLLGFAFFFQKSFEYRRIVEMIFDRIFAFAGDDNDVFDAGSNAFLHDILDLRLVNNRQHFLRLSFRGREKARAKTGGG